jgi:hypothetical protein
MKHHQTWPHLDHSNAVHAAGKREELTRDPRLQSTRIHGEQLGL